MLTLNMNSFIGVCIKKRGFITSYFFLLTVHLILSVVLGIVSLYNLFHKDGSEALQACKDSATTDEDVQGCSDGLGIFRPLLLRSMSSLG